MDLKAEDTYELEAVRRVLANVIHNVTARGPLRERSEPALLHANEDADELQNVWVGECIPEDDIFTKLLVSTSAQQLRKHRSGSLS